MDVNAAETVSSEQEEKQKELSWLTTTALVVTIFILLTIGFRQLTDNERMGRDIAWFYGPAARMALSGVSPYELNNVANSQGPFADPPWIVLAAIPFAYLPDVWGRAAWMAAGFMGYGFVLYRMKAPLIGAALFLSSPMVIWSVMAGQVEWLILIGLVIPRPFGLPLLLLKPQMGALLALYWAIDAWRDGGIAAVIRLVAPLTGLLLISFVLYGFWPLEMLRFTTPDFRARVWPFGLPFAAAALVTAIRRREEFWAGVAGPLIAPFIKFHSWAMSLIWFVGDTTMMIVGWIAIWVAVLID